MSSRTRFFIKIVEDFKPDKAIQIDYNKFKSEIMSNVFNSIEEQKKVQRGIDGGIYVGTYGNAYTLYHLCKKTKFEKEKPVLLKKATELIKKGIEQADQMKSRNPSDHCGFVLGKAGIYALGAAILHEGQDDKSAEECLKKYIDASNYCATHSYASFGGDELFVGRAGYICGALWLDRVFGRPIMTDTILNIVCDLIIQSGKEYSQRHNSSSPLMYQYHGTEYLGAAHGLCSILQMVLSCENYLDSHAQSEKLIRQSVDYLLSIQMPNGNFPCATDEIGYSRGNDELVHWCHGAPGTVYLMLKAYLRWKDDKYLQSAIKCGNVVWEKGLLRKGPGLCHGVAGNGYVFLVLYRVTKEPKYLYRANAFADFMSTEEFKKARVPDNPHSLYEGIAGTMCFFADLMEPETAAFPFMEII